ncbi:Long-chain-fatty-acid--CoA ligase [Rubellimicrobium mesophilum DSM 19309]|uniref:Long-chain-fatty-acid--CoA ligase n=1 Tax=Rubellimicrobium mesophilum DSM 19309 TaxID=442562 RepID=A0A017HPR4_9RHOB|nr:acyl-CoA synthetase [Rubellimicrobium mesophilum]EYD76133.1 Long-chain-fatty-acid--CoA ligase [Rubellimicrobium mesophilum DSM 19309]
MAFAGLADSAAIEAEGPWEARDLPRTTWGVLSRTASRVPDRPALTFQLLSDPKAHAETLSWRELQARVAQAANLFRSLGVGEGDTVAYLLPNCTEVALAYLGGQVAGIVNPINPLLDAEQIAGILRETKAKVLVTLKAFPKTDVPQKAAQAVALAPNVETVLEVDLRRHLTGVKKLLVPLLRPKNPVTHKARVLDFHREAMRQPRELRFPDSAGDRVAAYFHTGGTTGLPKLARHRYRGLIYNGWVAHRLLFTEQDTMIVPLPMFHVFAAVVCMGASVASGAHVVLPTPQGYRGEGVFDNFWKLIERWRVTFVITVPTAISALMQRPVDADISSLKLAFSGSAPLPVELFNRFEAAAGLTVIEGYGLTEATCLVSVNPPQGERKVGSIGVPFPYTRVRIIDPHTQMDCLEDEVGEICVSSPGVWGGNVYTEGAKNAEIFYPGEDDAPEWLRTGDLGRRDHDGYLWITGRAKDIIIRGGHNIDPAQIEDALCGHPAVAMAGAIGQPDAHAGEVPCVYVELVKDATATEAELLEHARAHVRERAAQPKHLEVLDELPKTAVGKIFKPDLRKRAIKRVYDRALTDAGLPAEVAEVVEDRKLGLVARLRPMGEVTDEAVDRALGPFTRPWTWVE